MPPEFDSHSIAHLRTNYLYASSSPADPTGSALYEVSHRDAGLNCFDTQSVERGWEEHLSVVAQPSPRSRSGIHAEPIDRATIVEAVTSHGVSNDCIFTVCNVSVRLSGILHAGEQRAARMNRHVSRGCKRQGASTTNPAPRMATGRSIPTPISPA